MGTATQPEDGEQQIAAAVRRTFGDLPVVLCGSRACGTASASSDYDVLVAIPLWRLPRALPRFRGLEQVLERELGVPVSVNPLPLSVLRRRNFFVWKLAREGLVVSGGHGFSLPQTALPPVDDHVRFSYLMTALLTLLSTVDAGAPDPWRQQTLERAVEKAVLIVAQLRLLPLGHYASRLANALAVANDSELNDVVAAAASPAGWLRARKLVLDELRALTWTETWLHVLRVNSRYAVLAALRRRNRLRAACSLRSVDRRFAEIAVALADAVRDDGSARLLDRGDGLELALPGGRRDVARGWRTLRDAVSSEWPDAHPLLAQ